MKKEKQVIMYESLLGLLYVLSYLELSINLKVFRPCLTDEKIKY